VTTGLPALVDNPLRHGQPQERTPGPFTLVLFGATGDLTRRKLVPALFSLEQDGLLPHDYAVIGVSRQRHTDAEFRDAMAAALARFARVGGTERAAVDRFLGRLSYLPGEFGAHDTYRDLERRLSAGGEAERSRRRLVYLATPPSLYPQLVAGLGRAGLAQAPAGGYARVVVEKPFGKDLTTARSLNAEILSVFGEDQVYRIDHYLGKETVQNILVMRFANGVFEPIWNRQYIDHVQITVAESLGMEGRGAYYEEAGALRDMVQNHMMQLLCLIAMEPPLAFDADAVRDEKVKVLRAVHPMTAAEVQERTVRGQYAAGHVEGEAVPGYLEEPFVAPDSLTETFVALRLEVDNWRWAGVPFYLRTGKRLPKRSSEIAIQFRRAPHLMFSDTATPDLEPNVLTLRIQPDEGMVLKFGVKVPGPSVRIRSVNMDFLYGSAFGDQNADAYERLLLDAMLGDAALFTRRDEVEAAWAIVTAILDGWQEQEVLSLPQYPSGSWGPPEADRLLEREGRRWRRP
jgi:glucose-6-phosphate 1-dehydrogenase